MNPDKITFQFEDGNENEKCIIDSAKELFNEHVVTSAKKGGRLCLLLEKIFAKTLVLSFVHR